MKRSIAWVLCFVALSAHSQNFFSWQYNDRYYSVTAGTGMTQYFGELKDDYRIRRRLSHASLGVEARLLSQVGARAEFIYYNLKGDDRDAADSSFARQRNLRFESQNFELNLQGILYLKKYRGNFHKRVAFDPYMGLGIAVTSFNPKTDLDTVDYVLRDFETEGVSYGRFALAIPLSFGVKLRLNEFINFNVELGYRYTFTDYLDDVSTTFIEEDGSIASRLSNRKRETRINGELAIINQEHFDAMVAGAPRGEPGNNDSYLFAMFKLEVFLPGSGPLWKKPSAY
ncbi:MAG: DUF6089 family protein [Bacteroidota bacterium]